MRFLKGAARVAPVLLMFGLASCQDFLDVNENPNSPETATVDIRLPSLEAAFIHSTYYGDAALWSGEWTQQFSFNRETRSYSQVQRYELSETDASTTWDYFYSRPGNASFTMIRDASEPGDVYYRGLAHLFYAWTFQMITDLWGPAPYTDAFKPEILEPKYDDQKTIYAGIIASLDTAVTELSSPTGRLPNVNDLLFEGDMSRWVKLAHYIQARTFLRIGYASGEDKVARANQALDALAGAFTSNADDADFAYPGGEDARNPNWMFEDQQNIFVAANYIVELLKSRSDPRLPIMFTPIVYDSVRGTTTYPATTERYVGHANGTSPLADSTVSWIGPFFSAEDAPLNVASYSDQKFTEAEARLIVTGPAAADAPYREGIRANMEKLGVSSGDIDAYLAARPDLGTMAADAALKEIITEKYITNFLKVEPWNDWRRTGYPDFPSPVPQAMLPDVPQRVRTPGSELSNNVNSVTATGIPIGLDGMNTEVWWAGGSQ